MDWKGVEKKQLWPCYDTIPTITLTEWVKPHTSIMATNLWTDIQTQDPLNMKQEYWFLYPKFNDSDME